MSEKNSETPYKIELNPQNKLSAVYFASDGREISLDPSNSDYCKFLTWAANQSTPIADSFEGLEKHCVYYGQEKDVVTYCKHNGIILLCRQNMRDLKYTLAGGMQESPLIAPIAIYHDPKKVTTAANAPGAFLFYRLYESMQGDETAADSALYGKRLPIFISHILHVQLNSSLQDENSEIRSLSSWPVEKTFVYVDVSGFSKHPVEHQLLIMNALIQITTDSKFWHVARQDVLSARNDQEANLCIGDGYIFVFRTPWSAVVFAGYLASLIESLIAQTLMLEFHFRISVNSGPVYRFLDKWGPGPTEGRWNYLGRGITDGERVLTAIGTDKDDVVFLSSETRKRILAVSSPSYARDIPSYLENRGRKEDKHKVLRRLYELNHTDLFGTIVDGLVRNLQGKMERVPRSRKR